MDNQLQMELGRKIALAKMRLLCANGFFGVLLMHMDFALSDECDTAGTDGKTIVFGLNFLSSLTDAETEFVLSHEVLHAALSHYSRREWRDPLLWNIACDLVVNATIMKEHNNDPKSITVHGDVSMHLLPDGTPGCDYSAEEVYEKLRQEAEAKSSFFETAIVFDDHSGWKDTADVQEKTLEAEWETRMVEAAKTVAAFQGAGKLPGCAERIIEKYNRSPRLDWRRILNDFLAPDEFDYSFQPPDNRYLEEIFLPGFHPDEDSVAPKNILFLVDTSGSVSYEKLRDVVTEVDCAVRQFPRFTGELAFFDTKVYPSIPINDETDLADIKMQGGGGTSFHCIFEHIRNLSSLPARLIILTDGLAPFPKKTAALGIPTCWVLTNTKIVPPWGEYCWL